MRKFGIKYSRLHPEPTEVRDAFVRVRTPEDWQKVLQVHYAEDLPGRYPPAAAEAAETPGGIVKDPAKASCGRS